MANVDYDCQICEYAYDMENKRPLFLDCGHTFCSGCLTQMKRANNAQCATCRHDWSNKDVDELQVVFQLVGNTVPAGAPSDTCDKHGIRLAFWCKSCNQAACNICLDELHKTCNWCLLQPILNEQSNVLDTTRSEILAKVDTQSDKLTQAVTKNTDEIATLRMFKMTIKDLETSKKNHEDLLKTIRTDLADAKLTIEGMTAENFRYPSLEKIKRTERVVDEEIPASPGSTLYDIALVYQSLGDDVTRGRFQTSFSLLRQGLCPDQDWVVKDGDCATDALIVLTTSDIRPSKLVLEFEQDVPELRVSCLLSVAALECPEIALRFYKDFWDPSDTSIEATNKRLDKLLVDDRRTHLREFVGHLDVEGVGRLPLDYLTKLGLALTDEEGQVEAVNAVANIKQQGVLQELHLSVAPNVDGNKLGELSSDLHEDFPLHLHFPKLTDDGLQRMVLIINKLMAGNNNSKSIESVHLPRSSLTVRGVELLLGVVHGAALTSALCIEAPGISLPQRRALSQQADGVQLQLSWHEEDSGT